VYHGNMKYHSTRNRTDFVSGPEAIIAGLAPDGGLYVPERLPAVDWRALPVTYRELVRHILGLFFPEFSQSALMRIVAGYDKFASNEIVQIQEFDDYAFLELYHGPTASFKDMALSLLPGLLRESYLLTGRDKSAFIMVATSGDTGSAALEGFAGQEGTEIMVLYPDGGVSEIQQLQMEAVRDNNAHVFAIAGNFDDAQRAVKQAFVSADIRHLAANRRKDLSSANSINIGRLVPQIVYYFYAYQRLAATGRIDEGALLDVSVPTGNFGDILAAIYAKAMGLPLGNIICASNTNKVLTDFFATGRYDSRREFAKTLSPSMDILVSSNLERYLHLLCGGDSELITDCYRSLAETGYFVWPLDFPSDLRSKHKTDPETTGLIRDAFDKYKYLIDPHTAVAYGAAELATNYCLIVSTASPYKFSDAVLAALESSDVGGDAATRTVTEPADLSTEAPAMMAETTELTAKLERLEKLADTAAPRSISSKLRDFEITPTILALEDILPMIRQCVGNSPAK
jgi:threonine synthase